MMIFSCSKNLDIPIETDYQFKTIATADTTILDCFTPTGDVTIYTLSDTLTVAAGAELEAVLTDLIGNMQPFTLAFPVEIILADGTTQTLFKIDDLIAVLEECGVEFDVNEEDESDDDADDDSDGDTDESDDDTDESDDDTDESDDDTDETEDDSDDDTDESDDDTDETEDDSDDDTDESDDDTDETEDDSDDDTDESDDDTDETEDDSDDDTDESDDDDGN